jgi:hypothetical protein
LGGWEEMSLPDLDGATIETVSRSPRRGSRADGELAAG